ncbi:MULTISPECIES: anti-phage dCTP deaminase [Stenotrophomonas]|uniref:anti-phage dCTP deaminase n=1 Tax=Stenotrophomonas TaxID=40323 RepID=UPI0021C9588A|nr:MULTISPECIES: anti-phage dCTP deaminase [Stenotrophomonas]
MGQEIFIGVVAPVGVNYSSGVAILEERLNAIGIRSNKIKLSNLISDVSGSVAKTFSSEDQRIKQLMSAGNAIRERFGDSSFLAKLAILEVMEYREEVGGASSEPGNNIAHIFLTLKNPEEINFLRLVYGDSFYLVSFYEPREDRVATLSARISKSRQSSDLNSSRGLAEDIVKSDEKDGRKQGQRVGDSFSEADFFVNMANRAEAHAAIARFVEIIYGHPFHTPTIDEYGMFLAWGVSLRSADLSRQVGAAYCDDEGNLIAVGCNDVPQAGGGQYWPGAGDARDFQRGYDSSVAEKTSLVAEVIERLRNAGWLSSRVNRLSPEDRIHELLGSHENPVLAGAGINNLLEHGRIVHGEMAGIADAAKRGLSLHNSTLYTTTFPCHVCARHVVAAGVKRVVYVEPYPKSRARDLHSDSIAVDSPIPVVGRVNFQSFNGVAPRKYGSMFRMAPRKNAMGVANEASASSERARFISTPAHYLSQEAVAAKQVDEAIAREAKKTKVGGRARSVKLSRNKKS